MIPNPLDGAGPVQLSEKGRAKSHREADEEEGGWELGLSSTSGGNSGIRLQGDWGLGHEEAEYGRAIYYDAKNYGPM